MALELVVNTILTQGRRIVTSALRAVGHTQTTNWAKYHRVLNRARWLGVAGEPPALAVVGCDPGPACGVTIAVDETVSGLAPEHGSGNSAN